jgi:hypothetical protein
VGAGNRCAAAEHQADEVLGAPRVKLTMLPL